MSGISVPTPAWQVLYNGADITSAIGSLPDQMTYEESTGKRACSIEVAFADPVQVMQNNPPAIGASLAVSLGYAGGVLTPCGTFEIDEYELRAAPDTFHIKAIEAGFAKALRTQNSVAYEGQTLTQIAKTVAAKHGFTVVGDAVAPDVTYDRVTQALEPDLAFLHRLANMHDYDFNVRDNQLIFYSRPALEDAPAQGTIIRSQIIPGKTHFKAQTLGKKTYAAAQVSYFDPKTKQLITGTAEAVAAATGDTLKTVERVENAQQASLRAQSYLHEHNMHKITGEIALPGTMAYRAGNVVHVSGFGVFDAETYLIEKATHRLDKSGWLTELRLKVRVAGAATQTIGPDIQTDVAPPGVTAGQ